MKLAVTLVLVLGLSAALSYFGLRWLNSGSDMPAEVASLSPAEQALRLVESRGCNACHSRDGQRGIGPSWLGSWGRQRTFSDGSTGIVDAAYLIESMTSPGLRVVQGYDNIMLPAGFTADEMDQVVLLIRELNTSQAE